MDKTPNTFSFVISLCFARMKPKIKAFQPLLGAVETPGPVHVPSMLVSFHKRQFQALPRAEYEYSCPS